jgi:epoxyqueuosine reductase
VSGPPDRLLAVQVLREECRRAGFAGFGVAPAGPPPRFERFRGWIAAGHHAGMRYLDKTLSVRQSPEALLPGVRSVVCLSSPYSAAPRVAPDGSHFARYAGDSDYHGTLRTQAVRAVEQSRKRLPGTWSYRVCVDSTPIAERSWAAAAGLGWIGKNGCLMDEQHGSYVLLAEILTDLDLPPDAPVAEQCGSCTRCLKACPTDAFVEAGVLDSNRCLAYWTIEHRGRIPDAWKESIGEHVFGCDICQEVCPWNAPLQSLARGLEPLPPTREEILSMGKGAWRRRFGATAVNRAARRGLQRNAAASAGACRDATCLSALSKAARVEEPGLSDAARWALGRLPTHPL